MLDYLLPTLGAGAVEAIQHTSNSDYWAFNENGQFTDLISRFSEGPDRHTPLYKVKFSLVPVI